MKPSCSRYIKMNTKVILDELIDQIKMYELQTNPKNILAALIIRTKIQNILYGIVLEKIFLSKQNDFTVNKQNDFTIGEQKYQPKLPRFPTCKKTYCNNKKYIAHRKYRYYTHN